MATWRTVRSLRRVVIDIENMPGTYGPGDYTHPKVTAIGWRPYNPDAHPYALGTVGRVLWRDDVQQMRAVAEEFRAVWESADFIIGHNIRRHDVKILNGWYMTLGMDLLPERRLIDTYCDQPKVAGLSRSLENLTARWSCPIKKPHLEEHVWEAAYDGQPWAVDIMRRRVMADVAINAWLYGELIERGLLRF